MKQLSIEAFEEIRRWIYCNARPLELALWQYQFEHGSKEAVLSVLMNYQNEDGGFGTAVEPDNWNPESTPYTASFVIRILRQIGFVNTEHPIYQGIFRFLENTPYKADYGWFFVVQSNEHYPHARWWDYNEEDNRHQSIGITAILSGFILRYGDKTSALYRRAFEYAKRLLETLPATVHFGDMGIKGHCELWRDLEEAGLLQELPCMGVQEKLQELVRNKINREKDNFMANPLEFVLSPDSRYYEEYKLEVESALDRLLDQRPEQGIWEIPWEWYNGNKYPKAFAISENWWKSFEGIEKLLQLKRFHRLAFELK